RRCAGRPTPAGSQSRPWRASSRAAPTPAPSVAAWSRSRLFFFKQKTAYEIGLGIPAEPLFRSSNLQSFIASMTQKLTLSDISDESKNYLDKAGITTACLRIKSKWTAGGK